MPAHHPTPKLPEPPAFLTDAKGDPIFEDSCLHARYWWPPHYISSPAYLWHIEKGRTGKLVLVADDGSRRVPLTPGRARELLTYTPSPHFKLADHAEVWSWWRASGWGLNLHFHDFPADPSRGWPAAKVTIVEAERRNTTTGLRFQEGVPEAQEAFDNPDLFRRLLIGLLYSCLHPRKDKALGERELTNEEEAAFVEQQRQKMRKLAATKPAAKGRPAAGRAPAAE